MNLQSIFENWREVLLGGGLLAGAVLAGILLHLLISLFIRISLGRDARRGGVIVRSVVRHVKAPLRLALPLLAVSLVLPFVTMPEDFSDLLRNLLSVLTIVTVSWAVVRSASVLEDYLYDRYKIDSQDNLKARKIHTQMLYLKRVFAVIVGVIALALILINFDKVKQLGTTILASAGIVGIVLGFASQRSIALLFAGFQVALTQPIRIDDVVIVENEWGKVEEITLTYVVIRIWDKRRLVVPISYFIETPFQNWTRVSADLLGTVYLFCDYTVPVQALREELRRILEQSEEWDREVCVVQVTDATEQTMVVRALMSASDASLLWTLRCVVREKLIDYIRREYPESLPRFRALLDSESR
jgi:small-conductance mechanosensitive channel